MKSILKRNRILAVIALIGLLASLVPLISRVQAEESNKYYDIVLDYNSMRSMARQSSQSEDEWLDLFKSRSARRAPSTCTTTRPSPSTR